MPGSAPARRTTGNTTPSGSASRATSRCSGSIRWWSLDRASRWALASASAARWVKLFTSMFVVRSVSGVLVPGGMLVADDRRRVGDQVAAGRAAHGLDLLAVAAGLGPQLGLEGGHGGLEALDLLGELDHPPHAFQVHAVAGQALDLQQPLDVPLGVAAGVGGGPLGPDQPLALVDPERLGVDPGQLGRDRDDEHRPVLLSRHGPRPPWLRRCRGGSSGWSRTVRRTRAAARAPCARASRARPPAG